MHRSNQLKDARQALVLVDRHDKLAVAKREQFRLEAEIDRIEKDHATIHQRLDAANARILPLSTDLADKLKFIQTMEQDLTAAKKQQGELARLKKAAATAAANLAKAKADLAAANKQLVAQRAALKQKAAALAALAKQTAKAAALEAEIRKVLGPDPKAPAKAPAKKK